MSVPAVLYAASGLLTAGGLVAQVVDAPQASNINEWLFIAAIMALAGAVVYQTKKNDENNRYWREALTEGKVVPANQKRQAQTLENVNRHMTSMENTQKEMIARLDRIIAAGKATPND